MITLAPWIASTGTIRLALVLNFFLLSATMCFAAEDDREVPPDWQQRLEMLRSVPYLALSPNRVEEGDTGVVLHDRNAACRGYHLACRLSAGEAFLMDMDGRKVHRWTYRPGAIGGEDHVIMLVNGDLVVLKKFDRLACYDWDSDLIWKTKLDCHHDVAQAPDGTFYTIVREQRWYRNLEMNFDVLVHLTEGGEPIDRWSTFEHLDEIVLTLEGESPLDRLFRRFRGRLPGAGEKGLAKRDSGAQDGDSSRAELDYFHLNTIAVLPENSLAKRDIRFRAGNLLICFRNISQIAILDKESYRLLWAWGQGYLQWPHHPTLLENGHVLVFDNGVHREYSRVVQLDPETMTVVWEYVADPPEDFYSPTRGSAQRLPNGNTLICESDNGRVFEVTPQGEVVWRWLNPVIVGGHRETIYRMTRLDPALVDRLLNRWWWWN